MARTTTGCRALTISSLFPTQGQGPSGGGEAVNRTNILVNEDVPPPWAASARHPHLLPLPRAHSWVLTLIPFLIVP